MRRMMEGVVIKPYGTGHRYARLIGYTSGGKTGTAPDLRLSARATTRISTTRRSWDSRPSTNPAIVVVVTINGTEGKGGYGGPASAPVFREVAAAGAAHHGCAQGFARDASVPRRRPGR